MPYKKEEDRRSYDRERKRSQRAGQVPVHVSLSIPVRLRVVEDVTRLLERAVELTEVDPAARPIEKARVLLSAAGVGLRLIEARELATRIEAIELMQQERDRVQQEKTRAMKEAQK